MSRKQHDIYPRWRIDDGDSLWVKPSHVSPKTNSKESFSVKLQNIVYMQAQSDYVLLKVCGDTEAYQKILIFASLGDITESLIKKGFPMVRVHRSYAVNFQSPLSMPQRNKITVMLSNSVHEIPIGRSFQKNLKNVPFRNTKPIPLEE